MLLTTAVPMFLVNISTTYQEVYAQIKEVQRIRRERQSKNSESDSVGDGSTKKTGRETDSKIKRPAIRGNKKGC